MWIEIAENWWNVGEGIVTPLAGVWIEIAYICGLLFDLIVTPLAGVWIEILVWYARRRTLI